MKRQWRATQMCWSVHKIDKSMDRAGKATNYNFSVISHVELIDRISFSLCRDNFCWAIGSAWQRLFCYPCGWLLQRLVRRLVLHLVFPSFKSPHPVNGALCLHHNGATLSGTPQLVAPWLLHHFVTTPLWHPADPAPCRLCAKCAPL